MHPENFHLNLNEPPEYGELTISFSLEPVSLQSSSKRRAYVKKEIIKKTKTIKYLLSGDVKVEIQWLLYPMERYESSESPDMDNIIKPILDGLSGPHGILVDDCQVQSVGSHWIDWNKKEHRINIFVKYIESDFVTKEDLVFVNMGNNLYIPFNTNIPSKANKIILDAHKQSFALKKKVLDETGSYYQAKMFSPIQRVFHKSRIYNNFNTLEFNDFKEMLEKTQ